MINFDDYTDENKAKHSPKWPYRVLIIGCLESRKASTLLNLINDQPDIAKKISICKTKQHVAKYQY